MTKKKIYRAGLIPYHVEEGEIKMMFMRPSDTKFGGGREQGSRFQIAKGKVDPGETPEEAAVREAQEELGLFKPNIEGDMKHLGRFLGRTDVYVAKVKDPKMFGDYTYETAATKWMPPGEFQNMGRDIHKPVVRSAVRHIKRSENLSDNQKREN